jgi:hypothetical protein
MTAIEVVENMVPPIFGQMADITKGVIASSGTNILQSINEVLVAGYTIPLSFPGYMMDSVLFSQIGSIDSLRIPIIEFEMAMGHHEVPSVKTQTIKVWDVVEFNLAIHKVPVSHGLQIAESQTVSNAHRLTVRGRFFTEVTQSHHTMFNHLGVSVPVIP